MLKLEKTGDWEKTAQLFKELEARWIAFLQGVSTEAAAIGLEKIKARAPSNKLMGVPYKNRLKRRGVKVKHVEPPKKLWGGPDKPAAKLKDQGLKMDARAAAIIYEGRKEEVRHKDPKLTLFEVRPKAKKKKIHPGVFILMRYNPWTSDTLPWMPPAGDVELVNTREPAGKVELIRKHRRRDLDKVITKLQSKGVKIKRGEQKKGVMSAKTISDIAKMALRFERGQGIRPTKPHWRPMIRFMKRSAMKVFKKNKKLMRTMFDPNYRGWKQLGRLGKAISLAEAKTFRDFQKRVS